MSTPEDVTLLRNPIHNPAEARHFRGAFSATPLQPFTSTVANSRSVPDVGLSVFRSAAEGNEPGIRGSSSG